MINPLPPAYGGLCCSHHEEAPEEVRDRAVAELVALVARLTDAVHDLERKVALHEGELAALSERGRE